MYTKGNKEYNKYKYLTPSSSCYYYPEIKMDYLTSRKLVYCPIYELLVKETNFFKKLLEKVEKEKQNVLILDFDGPKDENPLVVNLAMLKNKINDETSPFGHGYVVAALLAGFNSQQYCQL